MGTVSLTPQDSFPAVVSASLRSQVAVVRALADQVDCLARAGEADGLREQLIEELARLGCRLLEEASSLTGSTGPEDSGVFARSRSSGPRD